MFHPTYALLIFVICLTSQSDADNSECIKARLASQHECRKAQEAFDDLYLGTFRKHIPTEYFRPWRYQWVQNKEWSVKDNGESFHHNIDVTKFDPSDLNVQIKDGFVVIEAQHEEKQGEYGYVSRRFVWRYSLPSNVKPEDVIAEFSTTGMLTVTAPLYKDDTAKNRDVPIFVTQTESNEEKPEDGRKEKSYDKDICTE